MWIVKQKIENKRNLFKKSNLAYFGCFIKVENLDFLDFFQKSFITLTTGKKKRNLFPSCYFQVKILFIGSLVRKVYKNIPGCS